MLKKEISMLLMLDIKNQKLPAMFHGGFSQ